jgi:DNA-binding cell septation regulator SpoVG
MVDCLVLWYRTRGQAIATARCRHAQTGTPLTSKIIRLVWNFQLVLHAIRVLKGFEGEHVACWSKRMAAIQFRDLLKPVFHTARSVVNQHRVRAAAVERHDFAIPSLPMVK